MFISVFRVFTLKLLNDTCLNNKKDYMKGILYTRVSSDEQVKGTSLEFQEELCRKYCEQKGIEVVAAFKEEGETAKDLSLNNRKKFLEALEFCRKNKNQVQAFVVLRVDRFARNTEDHFAVRKILSGYGTSLHSVTEPIGNKPAEKFIETVLAGAAEYDNAIRKQRCTDGMLARINQGLFPWKPPIGYTCLHFRKRDEKKTEPDPPDEKTFLIIQRALKEYATGSYRKKDIVQMLNDAGLRTTRGKRISPQLVDRMLGKYLKFYAGIIVNPWTGDEKEGRHKPMITKEELYTIQSLLKGKKHKVKRERYNPNFPLRRTILCSTCNQLLTGSASKGHGGVYLYYHCKNKSCMQFGKSLPKTEVEDKFRMALQRVLPKQRFFALLQEVWEERSERNSNQVKSDRGRLEKYLTILEEKKKRVFEMREDGSYTKEEFQRRKGDLEKEITGTQIALNRLQEEHFDVDKVIDLIANFLLVWWQKWPKFEPSFLARFQKFIFPEGIPYQKNVGFGTAKTCYIFELYQNFVNPKSYLVALRGIEPLFMP